MKRIAMAAAVAISGFVSTSALAQTIGVSMASFDDRFLTNVREAMTARAKELGVKIQFEDAQFDIGKQLNHIQNFSAQKISAMIINPVDNSATPRMTKLATGAAIPLVYVNRTPEEKSLPKDVAFVGSEEIVAGRLQGEEIARRLNYKGNVAILVGDLAHAGSMMRTKGVEEVVAKHPKMKIVVKQVANWSRTEAMSVTNNWLVSSTKIDAIAANNDEMAIGAIMALQQAGKDLKKIVIGGVDATGDGLAEMAKGNLAVTVFQDAKGQGRGAVETAVKIAKGEKVDSYVWIPFELVTPANYKGYVGK